VKIAFEKLIKEIKNVKKELSLEEKEERGSK